MCNRLTRQYKKTRDSLCRPFPEANSFLMWIESLSKVGFHIGTSKNLHFYYNTQFLFYFVKGSSGEVVFNSSPYRNLKNGTINKADSFFKLWINNLKKSDLQDSKEIKIVTKNVFTITISNSKVSKQFFDILRKTIESVPQMV